MPAKRKATGKTTEATAVTNPTATDSKHTTNTATAAAGGSAEQPSTEPSNTNKRQRTEPNAAAPALPSPTFQGLTPLHHDFQSPNGTVATAAATDQKTAVAPFELSSVTAVDENTAATAASFVTAAAPSPAFGSDDAKSIAAAGAATAATATPSSFFVSPLPVSAAGATSLNAGVMFSPPDSKIAADAEAAIAAAMAADSAIYCAAALPTPPPAVNLQALALIAQHDDLVTELNGIYVETEQGYREQPYAELDEDDRANLSIRITALTAEIDYENRLTAEVDAEVENENTAAAAANDTTGNDPLYFANARSLSEENRLLRASGAAAVVSFMLNRPSTAAAAAIASAVPVHGVASVANASGAAAPAVTYPRNGQL